MTDGRDDNWFRVRRPGDCEGRSDRGLIHLRVDVGLRDDFAIRIQHTPLKAAQVLVAGVTNRLTEALQRLVIDRDIAAITTRNQIPNLRVPRP